MNAIALYACVNVILIGVFIILIVEFSRLKDLKNLPTHLACLSLSILLCISDYIYIYVDGKPDTFSFVMNYISNIIFMLLMALIPLLWLFFVMDQCTVKYIISKKKWKIMAIVIVSCYALFTITTPLHKLLFYVTPLDSATPNVYTRGMLYPVQVCLSYAIFIASTSVSLWVHHYEKNPYVKREFMIYASFLIWPSIGGLLQVFFKGLPLVNISTMFAFFIVFTSLTNSRAKLDELTGLNNKNSFRKYLSGVYRNLSTNGSSYLIVFDIKKFKDINDTYGHKEGDNALLRFSQILKKSCGQSSFLARYAEDEFMVVTSCFDEQYLQAFVNAFLDDLEEENKNYNEFGYKLEVTYSYAELNPYFNSIDEILDTVEDQLFTAKQIYKNKKI